MVKFTVNNNKPQAKAYLMKSILSFEGKISSSSDCSINVNELFSISNMEVAITYQELGDRDVFIYEKKD